MRIMKQIWRWFDEITGFSQSHGPFMEHSVPSAKALGFTCSVAWHTRRPSPQQRLPHGSVSWAAQIAKRGLAQGSNKK